MKDRFHDPRALDIAALCRARRQLEGQVPQTALERLHAGVLTAADGENAPVRWSALGATRPRAGAEPELWLQLQASAPVWLQCQRCLQPLATVLTVDRPFRFVRGQAEAAREDEDSEEDVLALAPRLDLLELIEDELILAMPLVPHHDECPEPLPVPTLGAAGGDGEAADAERADAAHPFAALAKLLTRGS